MSVGGRRDGSFYASACPGQGCPGIRIGIISGGVCEDVAGGAQHLNW